MLPEQISYAPRTARTSRYLKVTEFDDRRFQAQQCSQSRLVMLPEQLEPAVVLKTIKLLGKTWYNQKPYFTFQFITVNPYCFK